MIIKRNLSAKLPALVLALASCTASATIDLHRLTWDADPAHQAVIGFTQTGSAGTATVKYGYSTNESNWVTKSVTNTQSFKGVNRYKKNKGCSKKIKDDVLTGKDGSKKSKGCSKKIKNDGLTSKDDSLVSKFVRLTDLNANSAVYYRVCEGSICGDRMWFKTAPTDHSAFVMLAGGDTRTGINTRRSGNELLAKIRPLFVMHGGDYTNSNNVSQMKDYLEDWKLTFSHDNIDGMAYKRIYPVVATHGNHENKNFSTLCQVFGVDYNGDGVCNDDDTYGAFDISPLLRVYTLNTEYRNSGWSKQANEQNKWLAKDFAINKNKTNWRFAQYHKPFFPHSRAKKDNLILFKWWADEFYKNALNIAFESDTHITKVTHPVTPVSNQFQVSKTGGTIYAGEGSWGADARSANRPQAWTIDLASIQQFKIVTVSSDKVEMRTAQFDAGASTLTAQQRADNATLLPTGVNWWSANSIGEVVNLTRSKRGLSILENAPTPRFTPAPMPENNDRKSTDSNRANGSTH
ncbi:metallophosphoesterase [Colwellia piezophila]|uniref:metallophosphoesterase n=1 Tax=Colwellia piezophila TaxID=211668 RepID=UPI0003661AAF|nr:metallophosphoesterase [Colwellia piezophila]